MAYVDLQNLLAGQPTPVLTPHMVMALIIYPVFGLPGGVEVQLSQQRSEQVVILGDCHLGPMIGSLTSQMSRRPRRHDRTDRRARRLHLPVGLNPPAADRSRLQY